MKKIIIAIMMFCMLPLANALTLGQIITQTQLDAQDVDTFDLECSLDGTSHNFPFYVQWDISCFSVEPNGDDYIVIREELNVRKPITVHVIRNIIRLGFDEYKEQFIEPFVRGKVGQFIQGIRADVKQYQSSNLDQYNWDVEL